MDDELLREIVDIVKPLAVAMRDFVKGWQQQPRVPSGPQGGQWGPSGGSWGSGGWQKPSGDVGGSAKPSKPSGGQSRPKAAVTIYHGTSETLVNSILEKGLQTKKPKSEHWHEDVEKQPEGVYCAKKLDVARDWGIDAVSAMQGGGDVQRLVIFEAKIPRSELKRDPLDSDSSYVPHGVSPDSIAAVHFITRKKTGKEVWGVPQWKTTVERREVVGGKLKQTKNDSIFVPFVII